MAFWHNPLLRRTLVIIVAGLAGLVAIVATSLWLTFKVQENADTVVRERMVRSQSALILTLLGDAETGQRGYLLLEDPKYLQPYEGAIVRIEPAVARLNTLIEGVPRFRDAGTRISALIKEKLQELLETVALMRNGDRQAALDVVRTDRGKIAMDSLRETILALIADSDRSVAGLLEEGRTATTALLWINSAASIAIIFLAIAAGWIVARYTADLAEAQRTVAASNLNLEARVRERTVDLTRANEEIQRFAYIVSHDLRAPLVNIVGFTSELEASSGVLQRFVAQAENDKADEALAAEARSAANEDVPEAISFIRTSTTKMDRLINAILKLSREGRRELRPETIDLKEMFDTIVASVHHQLEEAGTQIKGLSKSHPMVSDKLALEQVFSNLIDNAAKYLEKGRPGKIEVTATNNGPRVIIEVIDNGRGIAEADRERIFELFRRAGTQDIAGEGIGLAHVRALVRRLGGDISVSSTPGEGSRFRVNLPRVFVRRHDEEKA